jgi:hypothetical protein
MMERVLQARQRILLVRRGKGTQKLRQPEVHRNDDFCRRRSSAWQ